MIQTDRQYYKTVMSAVGRTMLIFLLLFGIYSEGIYYFSSLLNSLPISRMANDIIYQIAYGFGYMLVFMLPVAFLRRFLRGSGCIIQPMSLSPRISPMIFPIVFAGVTICFAMAQINAYVVDFLGYPDFSPGIMGEIMRTMKPYEIVLNFIVISVIPAFCEEFLFRGAILSNCRPFGRSNAIIISAVLFALMHQNAAQLLYTFAEGIVLGLVYEYTGSIWSCTILHLFNNLISVMQSVVISKYGETSHALRTITIIEVFVYFVGVISIGVLVSRHFSKREKLEDGAFEKTFSATDDYATHPIRGREAAKLFFCPSMIAFVALVVLEIVLLMLFSFSM